MKLKRLLFISILAWLNLIVGLSQCNLTSYLNDMEEASSQVKTLLKSDKGIVAWNELKKAGAEINDRTNYELLKAISEKPELVEAWEMAFKHADLRTNTTALSKLNDIAGRGRGIDKAKLTDALNGDLGDVLNKATGDDLTKILNRMDAEKFTGTHLDEITNRLKNYPELKTDLLDNPSWFETFDDILKEPGKYWDIVSEGNIPSGSALSKWGQGKWFKDLNETARIFQNTTGLNKVKQVFGTNYGSQITLRISKAGEEPFEIVADYLAKDANDVFHIIDTKYTTLDNFDLTKSFTPNQSKAFPWIKNGDELTIEVRAIDSKLEDLGLIQGDVLDIGNVKIDIYKSAKGNSNVVESILNY